MQDNDKHFKNVTRETHRLVKTEASAIGMPMNDFLTFLIKEYIKNKKES
jgi:hypothetical protein